MFSAVTANTAAVVAAVGTNDNTTRDVPLHGTSTDPKAPAWTRRHLDSTVCTYPASIDSDPHAGPDIG